VPAGYVGTTERSLSLRGYAVKTELVNPAGQHLRYLPGPLAASMVAAGHAEVHNANGKIKSIRLVTAATQALLTGPPSEPRYGTRFTRIVKSDAGVSWIEHHPRALY
jgi:hypothetical protein